MANFGIEFVPRDLYWKTTYYAIQAEKRGFKFLWITDHFNNRNVYVSLSVIANYTNKIRLGPGVTNPYLIHPAITAQAVASLNEVAPGRVICGLGVGDKTTLEMLNVKQTKPLTTLAEAVAIIRQLTSGKSAYHDGKIFKVTGAKFNFRTSPIPIFIGAQGPKMLELAAELGNGVLINASHPKDVESAREHVERGIKKAGKNLRDSEVAAYTSFSVAKDGKKAMKAVIPVVAYIVAGCPEVVLDRHGIPAATANEIRNAITRGDWKRAFSLVSPEMVEAFSITGTSSECVDKIWELIKLGVTQLVVGSPVGPNMRKSIDIIGSEIMPHFIEGEEA
ncbi:TPA: 5,10-methylenetetrahydromethanopterin reductase [Candidatus Bathyarchaeota archaeon]|nr:5,10-methylenetetrahydromethanopterin reductase [Candidatus Bathyarchaeota archaeon]